MPYLSAFVGEAGAAALCKEFHTACFQAAKSRESAPMEEEEGEDLCNCEFSLAYGGKILLNNARLHLKRGNRYGLCGPNGSGKSTLMRAIANGQLDGFPPKSELRTVYVEHDIDASGGWVGLVGWGWGWGWEWEWEWDGAEPAWALARLRVLMSSVPLTPLLLLLLPHPCRGRDLRGRLCGQRRHGEGGDPHP